MSNVVQAKPGSRLLVSGNEAIARGVWEAGARVAAAYPGTPSTEILEVLSLFPDLHAEWSVNEKVALEVAIGACLSGARSMCAMKHVGLNVAADALMTLTLTGVVGGLLIVVTDDVGMSSSQNEQDSRFWGRFAHLPILEPADSQEAYAMAREAFALSERIEAPVLMRATTRVCHVKAVAEVGAREERPTPEGFKPNARRWVMTPNNARPRVALMLERERTLADIAETHAFNVLEPGSDRRVGFVTSGPAWLHVREGFPDAPILKLGLSYPVALGRVRELAAQVDRVVVVEETEPLIENELRAAGLTVHGKDVLPRQGELTPDILVPAINALVGEQVSAVPTTILPTPRVFPRPPTMCVACPHLGPFYVLSRLHRDIIVAGDIGCYTLGAGFPWNAIDTTICMGASMSMAHGFDKGRAPADAEKGIIGVIGDSTFLHMGMQGLLNITYNRGNVTILLLDNRTTGMTGGQHNPGTGLSIHGEEAPRVDFAKLVEALGVKKERIHVVDPYELPTLFRLVRDEAWINDVSVIITDRPCTLIDHYQPQSAFHVVEPDCTGCSNCLKVGCPAISVTRREKETNAKGREVELNFVAIDTAFCTGCRMCVETCGPKAIVPATYAPPSKVSADASDSSCATCKS